MASNEGLIRASKAKKDEFYTQLVDIEAELKHYRKHFEGKTVLCNCDDPYESNFFKYFAMNFNFLKLKKLVATCYHSSPIVGEQLSIFDTMPSECVGKKRAYKIEITEVEDCNGDGAIDFFDVEILLRSRKNALSLLEGDGDFRSSECVAILKEADIVVTNPPFSLFIEYVTQLVEYDKKFLIIGNQNAITYKEIFPLIMQNQLWLGVSMNGSNRYFRVPDDYPLTEATGKIVDGKKYAFVKSVVWFTNLEVAKRREKIDLFKKYSPELYPQYDNYDAIEVSRVTEIPEDYSGVMGVPITFLHKYNPEQFEIVGMAKRGAGDPKLKTKEYTKAEFQNYSDLNAGPVLITNGVPKNTFPRILIRRKRDAD